MLKPLALRITLLAMMFGFSETYAAEISAPNIQEGLEMTDAEKKEMDEFLDKLKTSNTFDLDHIANVSLDGNPLAMYFVGYCYSKGLAGATINRDAANLNFKMAASLRYGPAMFELFQMYALQEKDHLLGLVYLNLTIASGHKEYLDFYYQQVELLSNMAGKAVIQEIERIALQKSIKISEIEREIEKRKNTDKPALALLGKTITSEDFIYTEKYWKPFFASQKSWEQFFGIDKGPNQQENQELKNEYQEI